MKHVVECKYFSEALKTFYYPQFHKKVKEDYLSQLNDYNIPLCEDYLSQLNDYNIPFCERQQTDGSCHIFFKLKPFDQFNPPIPGTTSNFRQLLSFGTIESSLLQCLLELLEEMSNVDK